MSISAMKQALEALESWQKTCLDCGRGSEELGRATQPIAALRQAIAEAEKQEPVAWEGLRETVELRGSHSEEYEEGFWAGLRAYEDKLKEQDWYGQHQWQCGYERGWDAAMEKREWVGLTVEEIDDIWKTEVFDVHYGIARMVEAKLKEKNT